MKQLAHQPQIILIKTNIWLFPGDFTPFLPGIAARYSPFPALPLTLPGTRPLTCQGEKVLRGEKKAQITEEILLSY